MRKTFPTKIKTFFENSHNISSKEFLIYLCLDFSFLLNGIVLIIMGEIPTFLQNSTENTFRVAIGCLCIATWFIFLPILSQDTKDRIMYNFTYSILSFIALVFLTIYWLKTINSSNFLVLDILAISISIPTIAYLIYLIVNFFKLVFSVLKKLMNTLLPEIAEKKGLLYTLEAITSIFLATSSLIAAFWGIITAIKTMFEI